MIYVKIVYMLWNDSKYILYIHGGLTLLKEGMEGGSGVKEEQRVEDLWLVYKMNKNFINKK